MSPRKNLPPPTVSAEIDPPEGLANDWLRMTAQSLSRRSSLNWLVAGMSLPLASCGGGGSSSAAAATPTPAAAPTPAAPSTPVASTPPAASPSTPTTSGCSAIPGETSGPYPGDGTNTSSGGTSNVLSLSNVQRRDITGSISGYGSAVAAGVPLTINLALKSVSSGCATPLSAYAVYLWHCDAVGRYSLYSSGVTGESYLRGLQVTDSNGQLSFTSIFPGCYAGRWPHIHFEIFSNLANATRGNAALKTSQLALPAAESRLVFADSRYPGSSSNFNSVSLTSDNVFSDGVSLQMPSITGSVASGFSINLNVYL